MGYKYDENDILAAAVEAVLEDGLSRLTFGRLAKRLDIADRSIVYYFPTKSDLLTRTIFLIAERLQELLDKAFGDQPLSGIELLRRAWPVLTSRDADDVFAIYFELVGLGAANLEPFDTLAPAVMHEFVEWVVPRLDAPDATAYATALSTLATLDGLLLLRQVLGTDAADLAAANLGVID
jgi:AcrR family transcriptional regulator